MLMENYAVHIRKVLMEIDNECNITDDALIYISDLIQCLVKKFTDPLDQFVCQIISTDLMENAINAGKYMAYRAKYTVPTNLTYIRNQFKNDDVHIDTIYHLCGIIEYIEMEVLDVAGGMTRNITIDDIKNALVNDHALHFLYCQVCIDR